MKKITADFRRSVRKSVIFLWAELAVIALGLTISGVLFREKTRLAAIIVLFALLALTVWNTLDRLVFAPRDLAKKIALLPEKTRTAITEQYQTAKELGGRWFLDEYVLFHQNRRIGLLRYDEIRSAEPKGLNLELTLLDEKKELMPIKPDEDHAVLIAVLRSHNPRISAMLNGKVIEKMENKNKRGEHK